MGHNDIVRHVMIYLVVGGGIVVKKDPPLSMAEVTVCHIC